jgi:hypothetical protein
MQFRTLFDTFVNDPKPYLPEDFINTSKWKKIMKEAKDVLKAFNYKKIRFKKQFTYPDEGGVCELLQNFYHSYHYIVLIVFLVARLKNFYQDLGLRPTFEFTWV